MFLAGSDQVFPAARSAWSLGRLKRLIYAGLACLAIVVGPMLAVDSLAYGRLTFVPWNLVRYNVFAASSGRGPTLFGTEPWTYYAFNLLLSHNYLFPLAVLALPAIIFTRSFAPLRLHESKANKSPETATVNTAGTTTPPWRLLAFRAAPVYVWLAVVWTQPHKEERFLFPIYTLLCWNASVTLTLVRFWAEDLYLRATSSPYKVGLLLLLRRRWTLTKQVCRPANRASFRRSRSPSSL